MYDLLLAKTTNVIKDIPDAQVVIIGVGTVFAGLVCIVLLCKIIGLFCGKAKSSEKTVTATPAPKVQTAAAPIENRQQIIAAVSAAVAEELGTDISAIRILSFKKI